MLEKAADTFIAAVELLETEGRQLRRTGSDLTFWAIIVVCSVALAMLGCATLLVGVAWALAQAVGIPATLVIIGAAAGLLGFGLAGIGRMRMRSAGGGSQT